MRNVVITDGDILTPLGNLQSTWESLLTGKSGIRPQGLGSMTGGWPLGFIPETYVTNPPGGSWPRLQQVLQHLISTLPQLPEDTRLICATTKGAVDELIETPDAEDGQPWQVADWLAQTLSTQGQPATVSAACASGTLAIIQGAMQIADGECDHVFVVGYDLIAKFILSGFDVLKALSPQGAKPFDKKRNGLSLGDGAGWLLLSATDKIDSASGLATVKRWAISCDATHITAPCRYASGLINVLNQITDNGTVPVGGINAHGTGTVYNDAMELRAFSNCCVPGIPVCSTKGALGHSLGAAGIIEALLSVLSLKHGVLPPTIGLTEPEQSSCSLSGIRPLPLLHPSVISCNSGFGGINGGIFLTNEAKG